MARREISEILTGAPTNWGRWGSEDELGALNGLTNDAVLRAAEEIESGDVFPLGTYLDHPDGDPIGIGVEAIAHEMTLDFSDVEDGSVDPAESGGMAWAADSISTPVHGTTTHVDALGHVWYDETIYNGFDARTTNGGLDRCGIERMGEHGIVGRAVLLDIARHRSVSALGRGERISLSELRACADEQGVEVRDGDLLLVRTGVMDYFYEAGPAEYYDAYRDADAEPPLLDEPGPTFTNELVEWIQERDVPMVGIDTIHGEQTISSTTNTTTPLHPALIRNLGVTLSELHLLGDLAAHCEETGRWSCFYAASPLKIVGGTGSPINPIAIT